MTSSTLHQKVILTFKPTLASSGAAGGAPDNCPSNVIVTGTFDSWSQSLKMTRKDGDVFEAAVSVSLQPLEKLFYKFVVDGVWQHDPTQPFETDEHGNQNNVWVAPEIAIVVDKEEAVIPQDNTVIEAEPVALVETKAGGEDKIPVVSAPAIDDAAMAVVEDAAKAAEQSTATNLHVVEESVAVPPVSVQESVKETEEVPSTDAAASSSSPSDTAVVTTVEAEAAVEGKVEEEALTAAPQTIVVEETVTETIVQTSQEEATVPAAVTAEVTASEAVTAVTAVVEEEIVTVKEVTEIIPTPLETVTTTGTLDKVESSTAAADVVEDAPITPTGAVTVVEIKTVDVKDTTILQVLPEADNMETAAAVAVVTSETTSSTTTITNIASSAAAPVVTETNLAKPSETTETTATTSTSKATTTTTKEVQIVAPTSSSSAEVEVTPEATNIATTPKTAATPLPTSSSSPQPPYESPSKRKSVKKRMSFAMKSKENSNNVGSGEKGEGGKCSIQ